jgi:hypothetical protein
MIRQSDGHACAPGEIRQFEVPAAIDQRLAGGSYDPRASRFRAFLRLCHDRPEVNSIQS